MTVRI